MKRPLSTVFLCVLLGCARTTVPMAPEQSPHFEAVSDELHLGGTVYAYADIEGDAERAADFLLTLLRDLPELAPMRGPSRLSATALVRVLGLHNVKAVGLSSYERGDLYHNRMFIHHSGAREGLLRLFGEAPRAFAMPSIAPPDADLVWEQQVDLGALIDVVRGLAQLGVGMTPEELDDALDERWLDLDMTLEEIVEGLSTTVGLILSIDESRNLWFSGESMIFSYTDFLLRIDGMGSLADAIIRRAAAEPLVRSEQTEEWVILRPAIRLPPPWNAYNPAFVKERATGRIYLVSSPGFFKRCLATTEGVGQTPDYTVAFEGLPRSGNGHAYFSPTMTRQMHSVLDQIVGANGPSLATRIARFFLPDAGYAVGWVVEGKPNGLAFSSNTPSSHKSTLLTLGYAALLPGAAVVGASLLAPEEGDDESFQPPF